MLKNKQEIIPLLYGIKMAERKYKSSIYPKEIQRLQKLFEKQVVPKLDDRGYYVGTWKGKPAEKYIASPYEVYDNKGSIPIPKEWRKTTKHGYSFHKDYADKFDQFADEIKSTFGIKLAEGWRPMDIQINKQADPEKAFDMGNPMSFGGAKHLWGGAADLDQKDLARIFKTSDRKGAYSTKEMATLVEIGKKYGIVNPWYDDYKSGKRKNGGEPWHWEVAKDVESKIKNDLYAYYDKQINPLQDAVTNKQMQELKDVLPLMPTPTITESRIPNLDTNAIMGKLRTPLMASQQPVQGLEEVLKGL